jgi:hypothetical protein
MAKETDLSAEQLAGFINYFGKPMTASEISYRCGVFVDWVIDTANKYPDSFKQEPDDDGIPYYSHIKEDNTGSSQKHLSDLE